jgi:hypothetical protein
MLGLYFSIAHVIGKKAHRRQKMEKEKEIMRGQIWVLQQTNIYVGTILMQSV